MVKTINTSLKKILTGLTIPQEYVCVALEDLKDVFTVTLTTSDAGFHLDVSATHLFIGYKPLVMAVVLPEDSAVGGQIRRHKEVCLNFHRNTFSINSRWHGQSTDKHCIARLLLRPIEQKSVDGRQILFFEGSYGSHTFIHPLHQAINRQRERWKRNKPGNVDLPGNLHDMVRIAYCIPRIIPIITLCEGSAMNMFPTDLHGSVSEKSYVSSLRINGKANAQVEGIKQLALSYIDASSFQFAYKLGKNHMQDLKDTKLFDCHEKTSETFGIPLPAPVLRYRELSLQTSFDAGIHRIHLYKIVNEVNIRQGNTLAHIHQYYAQWRLNNNLPMTMLLR